MLPADRGLCPAGAAEGFRAIVAACDEVTPGIVAHTGAMMDEMARLGHMWEESWHATLSELQVGCHSLHACLPPDPRLYGVNYGFSWVQGAERPSRPFPCRGVIADGETD